MVEPGVLQSVAGLGLDLVAPILRVVDRFLVDTVDSNKHLLDTKHVRPKYVLARLPVLRWTNIKLARCRRNNKDSIIRLRRPRDHVLDEVTMARSIDDREVVLARLELPGNVDRDTTLTFRLQAVKDQRVLERDIAQLCRPLLGPFDRPLVKASALVYEMARRRLHRVVVAHLSLKAK